MKKLFFAVCLLMRFMIDQVNAVEQQENTNQANSIDAVSNYENEWKALLRKFNEENERQMDPSSDLYQRITDDKMRCFNDFITEYRGNDEVYPDMIIPKKIHYVWIGGPIYPEFWRNIVTIANIVAKEGYEVNVWVDDVKNLQYFNESLSAKITPIIQEIPGHTPILKKRFKGENPEFNKYVRDTGRIRVRNINELREYPGERLPYIEPSLYKEYWRYIDGEMVGQKNLAAAADLLRYLIIALEGGIYSDADLEGIVLSRLSSVHSLGDIRLWFNFQFDMHSGDYANHLFISTPQHPILVFAMLEAIKQYKMFEYSRLGLDLKRGYKDKGKWRRLLTIECSGPGVLQTGIKEFIELMNAFLQEIKNEYREKLAVLDANPEEGKQINRQEYNHTLNSFNRYTQDFEVFDYKSVGIPSVMTLNSITIFPTHLKNYIDDYIRIYHETHGDLTILKSFLEQPAHGNYSLKIREIKDFASFIKFQLDGDMPTLHEAEELKEKLSLLAFYFPKNFDKTAYILGVGENLYILSKYANTWLVRPKLCSFGTETLKDKRIKLHSPTRESEK